MGVYVAFNNIMHGCNAIFTKSWVITKVVFGWQHLDLDLKFLDLKSIDLKIPCLGHFKQWRIWNSSFEIPLFGYLNLDLNLDLDLRSIKYIF